MHDMITNYISVILILHAYYRIDYRNEPDFIDL